jgi:hypothetical protein
VFSGGPLDDVSFQIELPQHHVPAFGSFYDLKVKSNLIGSYCGSVRGFIGQFELGTTFSIEQLNLNKSGLFFYLSQGI